MAIQEEGDLVAMRITHVLDFTADTLLSTAMLNQVAIERANAIPSQVLNIAGTPAAAFSRQCRRLGRLFPEALGTPDPEPAPVAMIYGAGLLTELAAQSGGVAPAANVVVIVERRDHLEPTFTTLAELGWRGTARVLAPALFGDRARTPSHEWHVALSADLFDVSAPDELRVGLSFVSSPPGAEDLAFIAALRQESGVPVAVLAAQADLDRMAGLDIEPIPAVRSRDLWSDLFARAAVLIRHRGDAAKTALSKAPAQGAVAMAFQRRRAVLDVGTENASAPGITGFATEGDLFAFLRELKAGGGLPELLTRCEEEVSASLGATWHLQRLAELARPDATDALNLPPADAPVEDVVAFLLAAPAEAVARWLGRPPKVALLRAVLTRLMSLQEMHRIGDLHAAAEAMEAQQPGQLAEPVRFWLGFYAAGALASSYVYESALRIMRKLATQPTYSTLTPADALKFQQRMATILSRLGRRTESASLLERLCEQNPEEPSVLMQLALPTARTEPNRATYLLQKAIRSSCKPVPVPLQVGLANTLSALGRHEDAHDTLREAVAAHGDQPALRIALANAHLALGNRQDWADVLAPLLPRQDDRPVVSIDPRSDAPILEAFAPTPGLRREPAGDDAPLVAVIMTAYNAEATLEPAMRSVLAQTHDKLRLVVVDDASTDGTAEIIDRLAREDHRVAILPQPVNAGTYVAKNHALALVGADFYTFLDSDDWMHPCRIARHLAFMEENSHVVCSYSRWLRFDPSGRVVITPQENPASSFLRRSTLEEVGFFDMVRAGADGEFRWRLRRRYGRPAVPVMDEILTLGTQRDGSLTTSGATAFDAFGHNGPRIAYAEAWSRWHRSVAAPEGLRQPFPQQQRRYKVPAELEAPLAPLPHPFAARAAEAPAPANAVVVEWPVQEDILRNWGDKLNAPLIQALSGRPVMNHKDPRRDKEAPVHLVIGSGLANTSPTKLVWGSGFLNSQMRLKASPQQICAVRGPLSRRHVLETEGECPDVFGDPALLYPLVYMPQVEPRFDVGVIQHFREAGIAPLPLLPEGSSVRIIDINGGIEEVIDAIVSCRHIVSSSLHGIIAAHAYGVPATWVRFTDLPKGDGFKFQDYWASMGRDDMEPIQYRPGEVLDVQAGISTPGEGILVDLYRLLRACPFIDPGRAEKLVHRAKTLRKQASPFSILNCHAGARRKA